MIFKEREEIEPYVERILKRVLESQPGYLIIDNVDQLESDEIQNVTFVEAQAIARRIGINVIMSLRDATYLRHRHSPTFDAFQVETLFIDPPSVLPVLSRRFAYARQLLSGRSADLVTGQGARVEIKDLSPFFEIVGKSMLSDEAGFMLDVLSGSDIRRGLQLAREFLASGHTSADKALLSYLSNQGFRFPAHEIFRGIVLGQRMYFREEESLLPNIFDAKLGHRGLSLLRFCFASVLVQLAAQATFEGIRYQELVDELHKMGVAQADVNRCCTDLLRWRVIATADGMPLGDASALVPTRFAGYIIQELAPSFAYLDLCAVDANIFDDDTFDDLAALTRRIERPMDLVLRINLRITRATKFLEYLKNIEESWIVEARRKGLRKEWTEPLIATKIFPTFRITESARVLDSAVRRRAKNSRQ